MRTGLELYDNKSSLGLEPEASRSLKTASVKLAPGATSEVESRILTSLRVEGPATSETGFARRVQINEQALQIILGRLRYRGLVRNVVDALGSSTIVAVPM